jgi:cytochrome c2
MAAVKLFVLACFSLLSAAVFADDVPALYHGADLKLGEQLIAEYQCTACHQRKFGGDGNAIYRPAGKVNSLPD